MNIDCLIDKWTKELTPVQIESAAEAYEERAAIVEYDCGLNRKEAEDFAINELNNRMKKVIADKVNK